MAIHFDYVKGLNGDVNKISVDTNDNESDDLYTFIKWKGRNPGNNSIGQHSNFAPVIFINRVDSMTGALPLGYIITSNAMGQTFFANIGLSNGTSLLIGDNGDLKYNGTNLIFSAKQKANMILKSGGSFSFKTANEDENLFQIAKEETTSYKPLRINDDSNPDNYVEISKGNVTAKGHIDSLFFNATSDKRAKENIQPATYNAIELIKKLPVYTYNYKNKTETVTGILAQDLLEAQPAELELVSNINATGENGDYMSIKNDKLMFVLMKAIQEQQEQIEKLQEELNKLKESQ